MAQFDVIIPEDLLANSIVLRKREFSQGDYATLPMLKSNKSNTDKTTLNRVDYSYFSRNKEKNVGSTREITSR